MDDKGHQLGPAVEAKEHPVSQSDVIRCLEMLQQSA